MSNSNVYTAERIINERVRNGVTQYLIKWKGYPHSQNTWEPFENILDRSLISAYNKRQSRKNNIAAQTNIKRDSHKTNISAQTDNKCEPQKKISTDQKHNNREPQDSDISSQTTNEPEPQEDDTPDQTNKEAKPQEDKISDQTNNQPEPNDVVTNQSNNKSEPQNINISVQTEIEQPKNNISTQTIIENNNCEVSVCAASVTKCIRNLASTMHTVITEVTVDDKTITIRESTR